MSKFRNPKKKTIDARKLTDPHPRFVSLVQAGANQTPIRSIKVDQSMEDDPMKIAALKADGHEVKRITFKIGDQFADEAAVRAFLDEGGYDVSTLKATDDGFEVTNDTSEFTGESNVVKVSDDLEVEVGKLAVEESEDDDAEAKAEAQANKAGSAITGVKVTDKKGKKKEAGAEGEDDEDEAARKASEAAAAEANEGTDDEGEDAEGILVAGLDGSLKPIRKRAKPAESEKDIVTDEAAQKAEHAGDADCGPGEVLKDGKCVSTVAKVGDEAFNINLEATDVEGIVVPEMSFEVTEKVEVLSGDCGPGHTMLSVGGRTFCVPTGDRAPISQDMEVTAPNPAGGQGGASAGGAPVSGQVQREDGEVVLRCVEDGVIKTESIRVKFDEFSAFFSDGKTLAEVMDDADDGFPPGLELVILAAVTAMRNSFLAGDIDAVRQAGTDLGIVAAMLGSLFESAEKAEDTQKLVDKMSGQFADLGWPQAEEEEDGQTGDETTSRDAGGGEAALATALSELTVTMKAIADSVGEVRKAQEDQAAASEDLTERVEAVETTKQTRKGAAEDDTAGAAIPVKKSPIADIRLRGALGITQSA